VPLQEPYEVVILRHDDRSFSCRHLKYLFVFSFAEVQVANRGRLDAEAEGGPYRQRGRQLSVEPDIHTTTIG
jgi:hypothetical protein